MFLETEAKLALAAARLAVLLSVSWCWWIHFDFRSKHKLGLFRDQSQRRPPHPVSHLAPPRRPEELYPFRQRLHVLWPRTLPRSRKLRHSGQSDPLPVFGGLQGRVLRRGRNRTKPRLHGPGCPRPRRSADGGCSGFREKVVTVTMTMCWREAAVWKLRCFIWFEQEIVGVPQSQIRGERNPDGQHGPAVWTRRFRRRGETPVTAWSSWRFENQFTPGTGCL